MNGLYPFQQKGIEFMSLHSSVLNADEMGLGKSVQAILTAARSLDSPTLVICPAFLKLNWLREWQKWIPKWSDYIGVAQGGLWPTNKPVVIINYDILHRHYAALRSRTWGTVICDEAHYMQSTSARRTQHIIGYRSWDAIDGISRIPTKRRIALSGTPCDEPWNLWPILCWLDPGRWLKRGFADFERRYCPKVHTLYGWVRQPRNLEDLGLKLRSTLMIRRTKAEVLPELPAKTREVVPLDLKAPDPANLRDKAVLASHRRKLGLMKVPQAIEYIKGCLLAGDNPVIFAYHRDVLDELGKALGTDPVTGDTPMPIRQMKVDNFQAGLTRIFLGQVNACGTGLNLTASSHVIFVEDDWRPLVVKQAEDRCHRIGQKDSVLVTHLVVPNSLDERVARALIRKQENVNAIFNEDEDILGDVLDL